jgi:hypothetical protein
MRSYWLLFITHPSSFFFILFILSILLIAFIFYLNYYLRLMEIPYGRFL